MNGLWALSSMFSTKYTYDILRSIGGVYPPSLGGHYPSIENSGTFDNRGFEITVKHRNHIIKFNCTDRMVTFRLPAIKYCV